MGEIFDPDPLGNQREQTKDLKRGETRGTGPQGRSEDQRKHTSQSTRAQGKAPGVETATDNVSKGVLNTLPGRRAKFKHLTTREHKVPL